MGYNIDVFFLPDSPAVRTPSPRRWYQRREELPQRQRPVYRLFYDTVTATTALVRATPTASPRSAPTSRRSVSRRGCPLRPRVRRPPRQTALRWRAGVPYVLRTARRSQLPRPTRRSERQVAAGAPSLSTRVTRWLSSSSMRARFRIVTRDMSTGKLEDLHRSGDRRLRQRVLPVHQRDGLATRPRSRAGAYFRQPLLHADPPYEASTKTT